MLPTPQLPGERSAPARRLAVLVVLGAAALSSGCDDPNAPKPAPRSASPILRAAPGTYSEDAAFAIDGVEILKADIDAFVPLMKLIDPHLVQSSLRRGALANVSLPIAAGHALDPVAREEAFQRAQKIHAHVRETGEFPPDAPTANHLTGSWREVGLVPFNEAMTMQPGTYSKLFESPASWTFFKLTATNLEEGESFTGLTQITIARYDIPYLPDEGSLELIQSAIDTLPFEIVDDEWEHIVPPIVLYKSGQ